jgi:hypothetical protein
VVRRGGPERRSVWQFPEVIEEVGVNFRAGSQTMEQIEQLELRIEELREAIQRSRKLMLAGRACAIIGPTLLVCLLLGLPRFTPSEMIIGITLGIGGLVLMGSSKASTEELELLLKQLEEERNAAIDALDLVHSGS